MRNITTFFFILVTLSFFGQVSLENADKEFNRGYWVESISIYNQLIERPSDDKEFVYLSKQLAIANYNLKNYSEANLYFEKVKHTIANWNKKEQTIYFDCLRSLEEYNKVVELNTNYLNSSYDVGNFISFPINYTSNAKDSFFSVKQINVDFGTSFLGMTITKDTSVILSLPIIDKKEQTIFYDLFPTVLKNDTLMKIEKKKNLIKNKKTVFYRGTPCSFGDEKILFSGNISEYSTYKDKNIEKYNISDEAVNLLNLFEYKKGDKTEYVSLLNKNNSNSTTPFFDSIHQIVFFSSDRKGGKGGYDIYYSFYENGKWNSPQNVEELNTPYDEVYPFLESGVLTFSSRGHQNFGGLDNYISVCEVDTINKAVKVTDVRNLGKPINSSFDDFGIVWNGRYKGYLASNRISKNKKDDLLFFNYDPVDTLKVEVFDEDKESIEAQVYIYSKNEENEWVLLDSISTSKTAVENYAIDLQKEYKFEVKKNGYETQTITFDDGNNYSDVQKSKEQFREIILIKNPIVFTLLDDEGNPIPYAEVTIYGKRKKIGDFKTDRKGYWTFSDSTLFDINGKYVVNYIDNNNKQQTILLDGVDILGERKALKDNDGKIVRNKKIEVLTERELLAKRTTDEKGQFEYEFDEELNYDIVIEARDYELKEIDFSYESEDLERGEFEYKIKLNKKGEEKPLFTIRDEFDNEFENVEIKIYREGELLETLFTDYRGSFDYNFEDDRDYIVEVNVQGYELEKIDFTYDSDFENGYQLKLRKKLGTVANTNVFDVVYFGFNNYRLRRKTKETLRNVARYLDNNPNHNFIFYGHTDAVGPNNYNKRLAKKRVRYCLEYLSTLGDYSSRITSVAVGEEQVVNGCTTWYGCTKDENQVNRRVEILIKK